MERRLAAILAADVVGYSRLMEQDEAGTFERLRAYRKELFEPEIAGHRGRIFKLMGDGLLAEFASVVDAVECAAALQRQMAERNALLEPPERIQVRMGINLGDVIVEDGDRHGDGVNIAARLQQLSDPGGISVSRTVVNHVRNKTSFDFEPMGEHRVKNIAQPVEVYRLLLDKKSGWSYRFLKLVRRRWRSGAAAVIALIFVAVGGVAAWWFATIEPASAGKPAVAVLPLDSIGGDEGTERLAEGLTEDLITDLARFPDLDVIARNSTMVYKDKPVDVRQIGRDLKVGYLLEGSIQRQADQIRINAQLIDATTGKHLWSERWDRPIEQTFAIQQFA